MPMKAKRPCPKCGTLITKQCACQVEVRKRVDRERDKPFLHMYGTAWKKARLQYLREFPLCVACQSRGVVRLANVVDHIKDHKGDLTLFWGRDNWQSLCTTDHNIKTSTTSGGFGNRFK
jgi:5-methylcytosine-specific restriction protein A